MKKIKAKLYTISLIVTVTVLLTILLVQIADAEPTRTISGFDANREIFIADDGINNIIILQSDTGISKHYDSKVRHYNSGGFSMKSPESGILVFGHPINDDQYKLLVLTSDKVYRFIGISGIIEELNEEPIPSEEGEIESGIIEPTSSIGADITKYDIPIISRDDGQNTEILAFVTTEPFREAFLNEDFEFTGYLKDVKTAKKISDAEVTIEISRDEYVIRTQYYSTTSSGYVDAEFRALEYPEFYPRLCYNITMTMISGNNTYVWKEDFVMDYPTNARVWEPDMEWLQDKDWDYLPRDFRNDPRESLPADGWCN